MRLYSNKTTNKRNKVTKQSQEITDDPQANVFMKIFSYINSFHNLFDLYVEDGINLIYKQNACKRSFECDEKPNYYPKET